LIETTTTPCSRASVFPSNMSTKKPPSTPPPLPGQAAPPLPNFMEPPWMKNITGRRSVELAADGRWMFANRQSSAKHLFASPVKKKGGTCQHGLPYIVALYTPACFFAKLAGAKRSATSAYLMPRNASTP
jgi:hypothetical protein